MVEHVRKPVKFVISGSIAAAANFGTLYILTEFLGVWYLLSSVAAFSLGIAVSFILQKHWTFENYEKNRTIRQLSQFLLVSTANLALNTFLVYTLVERFGAWYMLAQFLSAAFIAVESFFIQQWIFSPAPGARERNHEYEQDHHA